jgi:DNA-binding NarL/FixJ family response regulator
MKGKKFKVVIADDQFLVAEGLKSLLAGEDLYSIEAVVTTGKELNPILRDKKIDLLVTACSLNHDFGIDSLIQIRKENINLPILILSNPILKNDLVKITDAGFRNIIFNTSGKEEILTAIQFTLKEKKYFSEEILDLLLDTSELKSFNEKHPKLTSSEIEIVKLVANGMTAKEIAVKRNLSVHTVNTHRKNIFRKLAVTNASELIMVAIKAGWIDNIEYYI